MSLELQSEKTEIVTQLLKLNDDIVRQEDQLEALSILGNRAPPDDGHISRQKECVKEIDQLSCDIVRFEGIEDSLAVDIARKFANDSILLRKGAVTLFEMANADIPQYVSPKLDLHLSEIKQHVQQAILALTIGTIYPEGDISKSAIGVNATAAGVSAMSDSSQQILTQFWFDIKGKPKTRPVSNAINRVLEKLQMPALESTIYTFINNSGDTTMTFTAKGTQSQIDQLKKRKSIPGFSISNLRANS